MKASYTRGVIGFLAEALVAVLLEPLAPAMANSPRSMRSRGRGAQIGVAGSPGGRSSCAGPDMLLRWVCGTTSWFSPGVRHVGWAAWTS